MTLTKCNNIHSKTAFITDKKVNKTGSAVIPHFYLSWETSTKILSQ